MDHNSHHLLMDTQAEHDSLHSEEPQEARVGGEISAATDVDSVKDSGQEAEAEDEREEEERETSWSARENTSETDQQSDKSNSRPTSESSTPVRGSSPTNADQQQSIDRSGFPHRIGINWRAGAKLEAKDFMEKWYPAKVVEVDDSDNTVLIHFDGWNQRYDEWLDMDSERIRPMVRHSVRRERREKAKVVVKLPAEHKLGENVFAKWTDCRMYPATIVAINTSGTYDVVFYDGFKKTVQAINVRNMPEEVQTEYARSGLLPELGKKQKQKIRELMKSMEIAPDQATKRRLSSGSTSGKEGTKSEPKSKETSPSEKAGPSSSTSTPSRANIKTVPAAASKRKRLTSNEAFEVKKIKASPATRVNTKVKIKQSPAVKQKQKDGLKSSLLKHSGTSAAEESGVEAPELEGVNSGSVETPISPQPSTSTGGSKHAGQGDAGDDGCLMQVLETGEKVFARKEFKVQDDHYPYHCQYKGCDKGFRKANLLQYHMKYYHTPDGGVVAVPPMRKRKKTTSVCSTDSEVSISSRVTSTQRPIKRKRDSLASSSFSSLPDPVFETSEITADHSLDTSEVDSKTTTTEEGEAQDALADEVLDRDGEEEAEVELSRDDVVNCICQMNEESGLMIQCEVCLCWQHALCMEITADTLPSKYICYVCLNPPGVRDRARFSFDQDWLKQGTLARFSFLPEDPNDQRKAQIMQATHELVADVHGISSSLNSTKRKLHLIKKKKACEKELRVWETDWDAVERRQRQQRLKEEEMERLGDSLEQDDNLQQQTTDSDADIQVTDSSFENKEGASFSVTQAGEPPAVEPEELGKQDGKPEPKTNTNNEPPETETVLVSQNKTEDIQEPPPPPECVTLLAEEPSTSQSYDNPASSVQRPEDVLARCEDNLLKHIDSMQDTIEEQLDLIENQVTALESAEETSGRSGDILRDLPRVKKAVHQVIGDLSRVRRMALFH